LIGMAAARMSGGKVAGKTRQFKAPRQSEGINDRKWPVQANDEVKIMQKRKLGNLEVSAIGRPKTARR